jgi:hypothetical protein
MHPIPVLLLILSYFRQASAWSGLGHCTVGYVAKALFTDAASNLVNDLLQPNDEFDICDAATWADKVRHTHEFAHTASWHFIGM